VSNTRSASGTKGEDIGKKGHFQSPCPVLGWGGRKGGGSFGGPSSCGESQGEGKGNEGANGDRGSPSRKKEHSFKLWKRERKKSSSFSTKMTSSIRGGGGKTIREEKEKGRCSFRFAHR